VIGGRGNRESPKPNRERLTPHQPRTETIIPSFLSASRTPHGQLLTRPSINPWHLAPFIKFEPMLKPNGISKRHFHGRVQIPLPSTLTLGDRLPLIRSIRVERKSTIRSVLVARVNTPLGEVGDDTSLAVGGMTIGRFLALSQRDPFVQVESSGERGRGGPCRVGRVSTGREESGEEVGR
jgi:hypothetical protein